MSENDPNEVGGNEQGDGLTRRTRRSNWVVMALLLIAFIAVRLIWPSGPSEATRHPAVGQKLGEVHVRPLTGGAKPVSASGLNGKVVLVNFWATWCPPCRKELPHIADLSIQSAGTPSRSLQVTNINGRVTRNESLLYTWSVTPTLPGRYAIPALTVKVNGQNVQTRPMSFTAVKSDVGNLLFVDVVGQKKSVYVGQALPLTLQIFLKPYHDKDLRLRLQQQDMWNLVSLNRRLPTRSLPKTTPCPRNPPRPFRKQPSRKPTNRKRPFHRKPFPQRRRKPPPPNPRSRT